MPRWRPLADRFPRRPEPGPAAPWFPLGPAPRAAHLAAWTVLLGVGAVLFASSFRGWGDPIIDLGRDLYLPSQILEGRVLYRDLLYNYGPTVPYLLAGLVAVCGDGLWVFETFGMLVGLATLAGLYAVGARLGGVGTAFATAGLFLVLGFFPASSWGCNFVLPYSFAATLATALAVWSFAILLRYLYDGRRGAAFAGSGALLLAALLTKQEVGVGILAVHAVAWWAHRVPRRLLAALGGTAVALAVLGLVAFAAREPGEHALLAENLARFLGDAESAPFFAVVAGLDRPGEHLLEMLRSAGALGLLLGLAGVGSLALHLGRGGRYWRAAFAAAALGLGAWLLWTVAWVRLFQAVPLLALGIVVYGLVRERRDPLLLLAVFALSTAPRVLLQYHPLWYGFYLLVPAYPLVTYALGVRAFPGWIGRRGARLALVVTGLLLTGRFELTMWQAYRDKTSVLRTSKGWLRDYPDGRVTAIAAFLDYAEAHLVPQRPDMVVLPEGVSLNYFTGLSNPTAYYLFTPPEIGSPRVEERVLRELEASRPEILVMTSRDLSEFGRVGIGLDYALRLGELIRAGYALETVFEGGGSRPWRLLVLRRRGPRAAAPP